MFKKKKESMQLFLTLGAEDINTFGISTSGFSLQINLKVMVSHLHKLNGNLSQSSFYNTTSVYEH